ncbi:beta-1,3-galactosyltransferase 1-like [Ylistrum balloti]|uniref:beta-1,3-galactosyltransferase 1-like n=1 Tax=Ylistrum balloti TaxID=509963 RepID=UPI00290587A9|nr:beta-1,3-galactosyltransferase 1-like [Ylistrum balloti]
MYRSGQEANCYILYIYTQSLQHVKYKMAVWGNRHCQRQLFQILLYAVLILGIVGLFSQILYLSSKLRNLSHPDDDLYISNDTQQNENTKPVKFLSYRKNFSYPLDVDIAYLVNEKIQYNNSIPHKQINPHPFKYMNLPDACNFSLGENGLTENETILVLVKSAVRHYRLRAALRSIWRSCNDPGIKKVFLLGYDGINQTQINMESQTFGDIIQEDFVDVYRNNTFKTIMGFNWALTFCTKLMFLFFMDDDYYLKLSELAHYLRKIPEENRYNIFRGSLSKTGVPYRDRNTRWYVTAEEYAFDQYPPYIGGGAYVVSYDVAERLHLAFPFIKYLPIDDVYLGIVAHKLMITPRRDIKFQSYYRGAIAKECSHDASELIRQNCPLARFGYNMYIHQNKRNAKNTKVLWALIITICILCVVCCCIAFPVILHIYCDRLYEKNIMSEQNPGRKQIRKKTSSKLTIVYEHQ